MFDSLLSFYLKYYQQGSEREPNSKDRKSCIQRPERATDSVSNTQRAPIGEKLHLHLTIVQIIFEQKANYPKQSLRAGNGFLSFVGTIPFPLLDSITCKSHVI